MWSSSFQNWIWNFKFPSGWKLYLLSQFSQIKIILLKKVDHKMLLKDKESQWHTLFIFETWSFCKKFIPLFCWLNLCQLCVGWKMFNSGSSAIFFVFSNSSKINFLFNSKGRPRFVSLVSDSICNSAHFTIKKSWMDCCTLKPAKPAPVSKLMVKAVPILNCFQTSLISYVPKADFTVGCNQVPHTLIPVFK